MPQLLLLTLCTTRATDVIIGLRKYFPAPQNPPAKAAPQAPSDLELSGWQTGGEQVNLHVAVTPPKSRSRRASKPLSVLDDPTTFTSFLSETKRRLHQAVAPFDDFPCLAFILPRSASSTITPPTESQVCGACRNPCQCTKLSHHLWTALLPP